jgi:hypothetical protein
MSLTLDGWIANCIAKKTANLDSGWVLTGLSQTVLREALEKLNFKPGGKRKIYVLDTCPPTEPVPQKFTAKIPGQNDNIAVSSYVVGTPLDNQAWECFINFCGINGYIPVVIPVRYRNPTTLEEALSQQKKSAFIDPKVIPYLVLDRFETHGVVIFSDIKAQITAVNPLNTISALSRGKPAVLPHPTQTIQSVPRMLPDPPVIQFTTGMVSESKMGDHLAAKKAEFHIVQGWAVVCKESLSPTVRLVHCKRGTAHDLGTAYTANDNTVDPPVFANWGDIHFGQEDLLAVEWAKTLTDLSICKTVLLHDTFDGSTVNHHEDDPAKKTRIFPSVSEEVLYHNEQIKTLEKKYEQIHIVDSNHNQWLQRWVERLHPLRDINNSPDRLLYCRIVAGEKVLSGSPLPSGSEIPGTRYRIFHGHETCNGGRMTHLSLSRIGQKVGLGHTHTPLQFQGVHNPGCLCVLDQDYTKGSLTSWAHGISHVYKDDTVQVLLKF